MSVSSSDQSKFEIHCKLITNNEGTREVTLNPNQQKFVLDIIQSEGSIEISGEGEVRIKKNNNKTLSGGVSKAVDDVVKMLLFNQVMIYQDYSGGTIKDQKNAHLEIQVKLKESEMIEEVQPLQRARALLPDLSLWKEIDEEEVSKKNDGKEDKPQDFSALPQSATTPEPEVTQPASPQPEIPTQPEITKPSSPTPEAHPEPEITKPTSPKPEMPSKTSVAKPATSQPQNFSVLEDVSRDEELEKIWAEMSAQEKMSSETIIDKIGIELAEKEAQLGRALTDDELIEIMTKIEDESSAEKAKKTEEEKSEVAVSKQETSTSQKVAPEAYTQEKEKPQTSSRLEIEHETVPPPMVERATTEHTVSHSPRKMEKRKIEFNKGDMRRMFGAAQARKPNFFDFRLKEKGFDSLSETSDVDFKKINIYGQKFNKLTDVEKLELLYHSCKKELEPFEAKMRELENDPGNLTLQKELRQLAQTIAPKIDDLGQKIQELGGQKRLHDLKVALEKCRKDYAGRQSPSSSSESELRYYAVQEQNAENLIFMLTQIDSTFIKANQLQKRMNIILDVGGQSGDPKFISKLGNLTSFREHKKSLNALDKYMTGLNQVLSKIGPLEKLTDQGKLTEKLLELQSTLVGLEEDFQALNIGKKKGEVGEYQKLVALRASRIKWLEGRLTERISVAEKAKLTQELEILRSTDFDSVITKSRAHLQNLYKQVYKPVTDTEIISLKDLEQVENNATILAELSGIDAKEMNDFGRLLRQYVSIMKPIRAAYQQWQQDPLNPLLHQRLLDADTVHRQELNKLLTQLKAFGGRQKLLQIQKNLAEYANRTESVGDSQGGGTRSMEIEGQRDILKRIGEKSLQELLDEDNVILRGIDRLRQSLQRKNR